jgi:hypothetical protein
MAYIGNTAASKFVSNRAASVYSGDGSTVAFTLEQVVAQDEDVLVSVDGVVQEPSVAYAVSSGTTLTFTAAPSNNAGNNIFVYYLASQAGTIGHPSSQALSATNGTFSGNTTVAGTGTFTGDVTIGDASAADKKILFDGNAQDYHIGLDDSTDSLTIGLGSALGTTSHMVIDSTGAVTKPLQPAFLARPASEQSNIAADTQTVVFGTEIFDQNSDFASNTFTAPVTGKYHLETQLRLQTVDSGASYYIVDILTSNRSYHFIFNPSNFAGDLSYWSVTSTALADMDAGDTAYVRIQQAGGTVQTDISPSSHFSGFLAC